MNDKTNYRYIDGSINIGSMKTWNNINIDLYIDRSIN